MKNGKWRSFNFMVEVCVESPKGVDEFEAAEDAAEFVNSMARTRGRVNQSFASIVYVKELPTGRKLKALLDKAKPSKVKKAKV